MFPIRVTETDRVGRKFIRLPEAGPSSIDAYFEGVRILQPFLRSGELEGLVRGFFLSMWEEGGIRFSYLTDNAEQTGRGLDQHFAGLGFVRYIDDETPFATSFEYYTPEGRTNLQFRRFLQLMTNVGLDLLDYDALYGRRLVAKYRLDVGPSGESSREYFDRGFKPAPAYRDVGTQLREELLAGLDTWHTAWEDWAHMLVVMLLPGDVIYAERSHQYFKPRRPLSAEVRDTLAGALLLPRDWEP